MGITLEWYKKAQLLFEEGNYDSLIAFTKSKIAEGNESAPLYFLLFKACRNNENEKDALFYIKRAANIDPSNKDYKYWLLICLSEMKDFECESYNAFSTGTTSLGYLASGYYKLYKLNYQGAFDDALKCNEDDVDLSEIVLLKLKSAFNLRLSDSQLDKIIKEAKSIDDNKVRKEILRLLYKNNRNEELTKLVKKYSAYYPNSPLSQFALELIKKSKSRDNNDFNEATARRVNRPLPNKKMSYEESFSQLDSMIGLDSVKEQVRSICASVRFEKEREKKVGKKSTNPKSYHFVFSGNPGTGKTTVARYFGDIFKSLGVLKTGHLVETSRVDLVGQYIGETAQKTQSVINDAMGGVLFIDEAYSLYKGKEDSKDFGREAIDTLVKALEDHRNDFIVIMAGYRDEMKELMKSNPGLESRFTRFIEFPDYTEDELLQIANKIAKENGYEMSKDGVLAFKQLIRAEMVTEKFGNARTVRNIMDLAMERKATNTDAVNASVDELSHLYAIDFGVNLDETPEDKAQEYINELNSMIGLDEVKESITDLIYTIKYQKEEEERTGKTMKMPGMHMAFLGNPGTGKTTVARIYANILKEMGILAKGEIKEASRSDLVGQWQGHSATKTTELCKDAYGGLLFIDEAYSLCNSQGDSFGLESISALIKEMEDNRDKLVVILAGYSKEMGDFFNSNSGIESRISKKIVFNDYDASQLTEIFLATVKREDMQIDDDAIELLKDHFAKLIRFKTQNFGNGREVRNVFEDVRKNLMIRVMKNHVVGDDRRRIIKEDVEKIK